MIISHLCGYKHVERALGTSFPHKIRLTACLKHSGGNTNYPEVISLKNKVRESRAYSVDEKYVDDGTSVCTLRSSYENQ